MSKPKYKHLIYLQGDDVPSNFHTLSEGDQVQYLYEMSTYLDDENKDIGDSEFALGVALEDYRVRYQNFIMYSNYRLNYVGLIEILENQESKGESKS